MIFSIDFNFAMCACMHNTVVLLRGWTCRSVVAAAAWQVGSGFRLCSTGDIGGDAVVLGTASILVAEEVLGWLEYDICVHSLVVVYCNAFAVLLALLGIICLSWVGRYCMYCTTLHCTALCSRVEVFCSLQVCNI